ncbi:NmrA family NAD(P)-binding protein [Mycolicibacterium austroafricanum]|uniref:NAD-dependent epimerase/dehydratase family protein n=1 Tax=Mycolicibacterium austroafricanum TaxID=39687 RepID=UPI001F3CC79E|nr:NmrA family NAD(P)-binding protein [Mycolicibacterium austroafricanum]
MTDSNARRWMMPCALRDDSAAETPVVPSFLTPGVPIDVFLTGARGYIGVAVAKRLIRDGHTVRGLTRTPEVVDALAAIGIVPIIGELDDSALPAREASAITPVRHVPVVQPEALPNLSDRAPHGQVLRA